MKYTKQQIYTVAAATLFLIGAVFMLVHTFAIEQQWAFWVGLGFAVVAAAIYIMLVIENRRVISKKLESTTEQPAASQDPQPAPGAS